MANQKGTLHSIPLKTMSLNLNRFNADIAPYEGFNKNNSPFFGNVLSPFYKVNVQGLGSETYVAKDGLVYYYGKDGNFYLKSGTEDSLISNFKGKNFLLKEDIRGSGNDLYSIILGFVSYPKGYVSTEDSSIALCSDREGNVNLIHTSGYLRGQPFRKNIVHGSSELCKIKSGEKVYYVRALLKASNVIGYVVCLQNRALILFGGADSDTIRVELLQGTALVSSGTNKENQSFFYTGDTNYPQYFTTVYGTYDLSNTNSILNKTPKSKSIKLTTDDSLTVTVAASGLTLSHIMVDYNGNVSFYGPEYKIQQADNQWRVCETGIVRGYESDGTLVINVKGYNLISDISNLAVSLLDSNNFSQYCSDAVIGAQSGTYTKITPGTYTTVETPITVTEYIEVAFPGPVGGVIKRTVPTTKVVGYEKTQVYSGDVKTTIPGAYRIKLLDSQRSQTWESIPISSEGHFQGGLMTTINDTFRVLYHGGVLQAVSIADDTETIGTLLCGMSEIDDASPISYKKTVRSSDNVSYSELYYKDSKSWVRITATPTPENLAVGNDPIKPNFTRTFQILNDRYILLNTSVYFNCFDTIDKKWYHFASDYNDRCIFTFESKNDGVPQNLADYLSGCENWYFATAQGANYETLNRPFISTLFSPYVSAVPKKVKITKTVVQSCYTPDEEDVDLYRGKQADVGNAPDYIYSQTGLIGGGGSTNTNEVSTSYQNQKLVDTNYAFGFTLTPSIFAKFISGFINQGIIVDNNHSYLQVFANTTKPVFAVNFVSQLEGVEAAFIIQGQYFVLISGSIYRYDPSTSAISAIVNIGDMILLGYTPYQALFFSKTNRTIYTFVGDNTLSFLTQADEIEQIYSSVYNPNTCSIYVLASSGIYIFGNDQLLRLDFRGYTRGYSLGLGAAFVSDTDTMFISYTRDNKPSWVQSDMKRIPIELETKFYGEGNNIKSVNDCVYIRLYDEYKGAGKVTLKCQTLNEGTWVSEEKTFNITSEMWDKVHKTLFLRYQPKYQEGAGFSVSIKSPFCIASLDISETPQTVQNSKNNA